MKAELKGPQQPWPGRVLMKCGHVAQGYEHMKDGRERPACVICLGLTPDAVIVEKSTPDLTGRKAYCTYCHKEAESKITLPFFEYGRRWKGEHLTDEDRYYCGCRGWD